VDPAGAVVPGVTVSLLNPTTGQTQTTMTDAKGLYAFSLLSPGTYDVEFSAQGFKTSRAMSVVVNVSEAPDLDAQLETGASEERVPCQCQFSETATSSIGTLVDSKTITAVPLTTRNLTQVLSMSSGSTASVNNAGTLGAGSQSVNVNGNTATGTFTVDGAVSTSTVPNPDTISEFKIQTSQYDAGYGTRVPNTNLVTRTGENEFHGDAWEFLRNDIFNANAFFRNAAGQPRATLKQNQFGGTLGGPIRRDKLFFFGSYQGTRQVNGLDPTASLSTVILPPLTNDRSAATIGSQFCPANKEPAAQSRYLTFAGGVQVACDGSNINPVALKLLQLKQADGSYLIPTPQTILSSGVNAGLGYSSYSLPSTYDEDQVLANISYLISRKHTLTGRLYHATANTQRAYSSDFLRSPETPPTPGFPVTMHETNYITSMQLSSVLTSNLANEARMTFTDNLSTPAVPGLASVTSVGMTPANVLSPGLPDITMRGSLGGFQAGNVYSDFLNGSRSYSWSDTLSWTHGRHTIRTGVFALTQHLKSSNIGLARGRLAFQNFTDFLLGMSAAQNGSPQGLSNIQSIEANEGMGPLGAVVLSQRFYHTAAFVQGDLKAGARLTLNLGLRWEYLPPSFGEAQDLGNAWPSLLQTVPIPPASGTYVGMTVPSDYNPNRINPYTGQPFGPPPPVVIVRPNKGLYENGAPLDSFASLWLCVATRKQAEPRGCARWVWMVLPTPRRQGKCARHSFDEYAASCPTHRSFGSWQQYVDTANAIPSHNPWVCTTNAFLKPGGPDYRTDLPASEATTMEPERAVRRLQQFQFRPGLCWIVRKKSVSLLWLQPAAPGNSGTSGKLRAAGYARCFGRNARGLRHAGSRSNIGLRHDEYLRQCLPARPYRRRGTHRLISTPVSRGFLVPQHAGHIEAADFERLELSSCLHFFQGRGQYNCL